MAWAVPLPPVSGVVTVSTMLFLITAPLTTFLTSIPTAAPDATKGSVTENPSMVTFDAAILKTGTAPVIAAPVTVDSGATRPGAGFPACAPLRVRDLPIETFSTYTPAATLIVEQVGSLTA